MNVMNRFTLRSMKANRKWTVVTIIGIILSTAMITAVSTFCASFMELLRNEAIIENGNWHAMVPGIHLQDVAIFEEAGFAPEVALSRDTGYALITEGKNAHKPYLFIREFGAKSYENFPVELIEGRLPQNSGELLISKYLEENGGVKYQVGDTLTLNIGKRLNSNGSPLGQNDFYAGEPVYENGQLIKGEVLAPDQVQTYTVVGIIKQPNFERNWSPGYPAITYLDEKKLKPDETVTVTLLAGKLKHSFFDDVTAIAAKAGIEPANIQFNGEVLRYSGIVANDNAQKMLYGFAGVFVLIIIVASVSLIYNAFAISVSERISQMGMLASVGATKRQKRRSVYFEGAVLGAVGIPLGIISGIAGIGITFSVIRPLLESFLNLSSEQGLVLYVSFPSMAAAVALAALTIFISVWIPARRASRIMPIDAIRQSQEIKLTRKAVKTSRLTRAIFGFEGEIALKNLKRSRKKYRATVLSLTISLVLFLTVSYYTEAIQASFDSAEMGYNFDLAVTYANMPSAEIQEVNRKIMALKGVEDTSLIQTTGGFLQADDVQLSPLVKRTYASAHQDRFNFNATVYSLDDVTFDDYVSSLGADPQQYRNPENPNLILINYGQSYFNGKRTAGELFSMKPGERLLFSVNPSPENVRENSGEDGVELQVGLLTDQRPMGILVSSLNHVAVVVSREVFESLPPEMKSLDENGNPHFQQTYLTAANPDEIQTQIQEMTKKIAGNAHMYIFNVAQEARSERNVMLVIGIFIYGFIVLISLICIANIFNTITTNISLRRREFAMLRSVGMTPESFNRMIRFESIFYGLKALWWGLPISLAVSLLLHYMQADVFDVGFTMPWASYGAAIVLIFAIVGVTMLYSSAKIKKENIIDALKSETM